MSEWEEIYLSDVGTLARGKSKYRPRWAEHLYGGPYPFIQTGNISATNKYITTYQQTYSEAGLKQSKLWDKGTLCITIAANIAEIAILEFPACFPDSVLGFIPDSKKADLDFVFYTLTFFKGKIQNLAIGSVQENINLGTFQNIKFLFPAIEEQKNVAAVLSCLDRKIENLRRQNETLEAIAQTLFKHWFIDFEFPYDFAQGKPNADGKPYKSSGGKMERSELGKIPAGWRVGKLGDFGKVITGKTPSTRQTEYWGGKLSFVTPTDFKNYGKFVLNSERKLSAIAASEFKRLIIPENSVVVTCIGSDMGKVAITAIPCVTNQQLNALIFSQLENGIEYVYQFLVSQFKMLRLIALGGSTMPIINKTDFSNIKILVPGLSTLDQFNQVVEAINLKIINNEQQIQTLTQTRDVLLPKLMSGQLRVTP